MSFVWKNWLAAIAVTALLCSGQAYAQSGKISTVWFNPPGTESDREFVEVKLTSLGSGYNFWFVAVENEDGSKTDPGQIDDTHQLVAATGFKAYSIDGSTCLGTAQSSYTQDLEGSGATYLLIAAKTGATQPSAAGANWDDLDNVDEDPKDGEFDSDITSKFDSGDWVLLDAIGVIGEAADITKSGIYGGTYGAPVCFKPGSGTPLFAPTAINTDVRCVGEKGSFNEIELVERCGDLGTWFAANVTDNATNCTGLSGCEFAISPDAESSSMVKEPECVDVDNKAPHTTCSEILTSATWEAANSSCSPVACAP